MKNSIFQGSNRELNTKVKDFPGLVQADSRQTKLGVFTSLLFLISKFSNICFYIVRFLAVHSTASSKTFKDLD